MNQIGNGKTPRRRSKLMKPVDYLQPLQFKSNQVTNLLDYLQPLPGGECVKCFYHVLEYFSTPKIKGGRAKNV